MSNVNKCKNVKGKKGKKGKWKKGKKGKKEKRKKGGKRKKSAQKISPKKQHKMATAKFCLSKIKVRSLKLINPKTVNRREK